jgi:hypothetical protein
MWSDKTTREVAITVFLVMCVVVFGILYRASVLVVDLTRDVDSITANANTLLVTANATLAEAKSASTQAALAAAEQRAYWNKTSLETYKTMAALRLTIVRTDQSVNDVLVPRVSASLDASTALERTATESVADTTARLDATIDALRPAIANLVQTSAGASAAMEAAGKDLSDPAIHETLAHVDGTAGNVDAASRDIAAFVHRETTPARGTWNVIKSFLREFAGPAAQVATAVK